MEESENLPPVPAQFSPQVENRPIEDDIKRNVEITPSPESSERDENSSVLANPKSLPFIVGVIIFFFGLIFINWLRPNPIDLVIGAKTLENLNLLKGKFSQDVDKAIAWREFSLQLEDQSQRSQILGPDDLTRWSNLLSNAANEDPQMARSPTDLLQKSIGLLHKNIKQLKEIAEKTGNESQGGQLGDFLHKLAGLASSSPSLDELNRIRFSCALVVAGKTSGGSSREKFFCRLPSNWGDLRDLQKLGEKAEQPMMFVDALLACLDLSSDHQNGDEDLVCSLSVWPGVPLGSIVRQDPSPQLGNHEREFPWLQNFMDLQREAREDHPSLQKILRAIIGIDGRTETSFIRKYGWLNFDKSLKFLLVDECVISKDKNLHEDASKWFSSIKPNDAAIPPTLPFGRLQELINKLDPEREERPLWKAEQEIWTVLAQPVSSATIELVQARIAEWMKLAPEERKNGPFTSLVRKIWIPLAKAIASEGRSLGELENARAGFIELLENSPMFFENIPDNWHLIGKSIGTDKWRVQSGFLKGLKFSTKHPGPSDPGSNTWELISNSANFPNSISDISWEEVDKKRPEYLLFLELLASLWLIEALPEVERGEVAALAYSPPILKQLDKRILDLKNPGHRFVNALWCKLPMILSPSEYQKWIDMKRKAGETKWNRLKVAFGGFSFARAVFCHRDAGRDLVFSPIFEPEAIPKINEMRRAILEGPPISLPSWLRVVASETNLVPQMLADGSQRVNFWKVVVAEAILHGFIQRLAKLSTDTLDTYKDSMIMILKPPKDLMTPSISRGSEISTTLILPDENVYPWKESLLAWPHAEDIPLSDLQSILVAEWCYLGSQADSGSLQAIWEVFNLNHRWWNNYASRFTENQGLMEKYFPHPVQKTDSGGQK